MVIKIRGYVITYKPNDASSRTAINHLLFGRMVARYYNGRKTVCYMKGMLHNTRFGRLMDSKIFVESLKPIDFEKLEEFGKITHAACLRNTDEIRFLTGHDYWKHLASEKGLILKSSANQRRI